MNKSKIFFNRPIKRDPWGGGTHFITSFYDHLVARGHEVVFSLQDGINVIFMFDPRPSRGGDGVNDIYQYKVFNPSCKIVQRINDTDVARPNDKPWRIELLLYANQIVDHTIFISEWVKNHYIEKGFDNKKPNTVIINGCNSEWYFPDSEKKLDVQKINLITHHWSDNFMKGFDVYNFLDEFISGNNNFNFTYAGRYNKDYIPKNTKLISPIYGSKLGDLLRSSDIYITGARWEACGMHHIEAARCGLPILYHKDGGAIPEVCNNHGVEFSNLDDLTKKLEMLVDQYDIIRNKIDYNFLSSERCFEEYELVIK